MYLGNKSACRVNVAMDSSYFQYFSASNGITRFFFLHTQRTLQSDFLRVYYVSAKMHTNVQLTQRIIITEEPTCTPAKSQLHITWTWASSKPIGLSGQVVHYIKWKRICRANISNDPKLHSESRNWQVRFKCYLLNIINKYSYYCLFLLLFISMFCINRSTHVTS